MTEKKRMDDPIVSVIMPAYNMERYINQAIASVVAQTMTQWELLIIDDCSTDSTLEIASPWAERDARIRALCNESNSGVAERETGELSWQEADTLHLWTATMYGVLRN